MTITLSLKQRELEKSYYAGLLISKITNLLKSTVTEFSELLENKQVKNTAFLISLQAKAFFLNKHFIQREYTKLIKSDSKESFSK